ncbi:MAG TPA: tRNA (cytidine(34)-2'-O)-methyltransferase, partial [Rhodocyclaceae bacterium]|jgi:tRNA (cytidine/uridine-2'-O-)-methyltransferase|nr:tRNA (cytidine(34)-2'-O)-methyltransferase [Rhodocyclaceae bacterium]
MFHIVLYQPEIPPNTGNTIRLAANSGCTLHLVKPLGFDLSDAQLRRAGMDYSEIADLRIHENWEDCLVALNGARLFALSTRGTTRHDKADYQAGDAFVFGPETRGLPQDLLDSLPIEQRIRVPLVPGNRSLNLSNTVALVVYEAWRHLDFAGGS